MQQDIRKWCMKPHDKDNGNESMHDEDKKIMNVQQELSHLEKNPGSGRKKTSKYFSKNEPKPEEEEEQGTEPQEKKNIPDTKKRTRTQVSKKLLKESSDESEDMILVPKKAKGSATSLFNKLKKTGDRNTSKKEADDENYKESEEEDEVVGKSRGRGRGVRGGNVTSASGKRGRGGRGRGGFMNFGERKDPPHKGEKEVPDGSPDCLAFLTFVISGTLDSLEREEAEDLIKRHGGRVTSSVSKKTRYLLCDEDVEGRKSTKAKELGTPFLTEDGLFDMIRSSKRQKRSVDEKRGDSPKKVMSSKKFPKKDENHAEVMKKASSSALSVDKPKTIEQLSWTDKYKPKIPNDIVGNQSLVNQIHTWLKRWDEQFADNGKKGKGKKQSDPGSKKALLLSGSPGIGKTTSAKLVSQMLGYLAIEVNASDSRGKADGKIFKGIGGSNANCIKELVSNQNIRTDLEKSKHPKTVLIMDEVDGMSAGDRGGVADLINSIKISKIPIICICNDRYSQKLKSLVNYCLVLSFRKPTKQQMAKRLMVVATSEGLQINEIALEELAERSNGDVRMALNQLQYLSLSMSVLKYDDVRKRLLSSAKDEDISPFTAVDKMFGFNGGKLKMDERIDLSMSDLDLVPLIVQENYMNYRPSSAGKDDSGTERMNRISRAAESIADGDIINVQIRRHRQWQLSQNGAVSSCIIPSALLHGNREILEEGERNFNRFGGWLGKNSTLGKNMRLLEDLHYHLLASRETNVGRETIRLDYQTLLLKRLTEPLRMLPKEEGVGEVVKFMNEYSISQEDVETLVGLSKFQGHASPLDGIASAVKAALTRAYKEQLKSRMVRSADLIQLPGIKRAPKKRIAAMLQEPEDAHIFESEEDDASDSDDIDQASNAAKIQSQIECLGSKAIKVDVQFNSANKSSSATQKTPKSSHKPSAKRKRS